MLMALVLTLRATQAAILPSALGRANYMAVLEHLRQFDSTLHDELTHRSSHPLTCSGLLHNHKKIIDIRPGMSYQVRITGLTTPVCQYLQTAFIEQQPEVWQLHNYEFIVTEVSCDTKLHPWSGQTSYDAMAYHHLQAQCPSSNQVTLEFYSPTACTDQKIIHSVPLPNLVFGNLLERWNEFAEVTLESAMAQFVKNNIAISKFRLNSQPVYQIGNIQHIGSIGEITYTVLRGDNYQRALINLLANYSFYSGVGIETSSGMGQVRSLSSARPMHLEKKRQSTRRRRSNPKYKPRHYRRTNQE